MSTRGTLCKSSAIVVLVCLANHISTSLLWQVADSKRVILGAHYSKFWKAECHLQGHLIFLLRLEVTICIQCRCEGCCQVLSISIIEEIKMFRLRSAELVSFFPLISLITSSIDQDRIYIGLFGLTLSLNHSYLNFRSISLSNLIKFYEIFVMLCGFSWHLNAYHSLFLQLFFLTAGTWFQ